MKNIVAEGTQVKNGLNMYSPAEVVSNYSKAGAEKAGLPVYRMLLMGFLAGAFIAFGGVTANTAVFAVGNISAARMISGLLFPFGLGMVILLGTELFTGNSLISISVFNGDTSFAGLIRNLFFVYIGNFAGAVSVAAACAFFGQFNYSSGALAVFTIKMAAAKCALPFGSAFVLGILCNVLVCAGVLCSLSAKDTAGRILGAYIPVAFFVIAGFEHCVANMYYIPAGLFAMKVPEYAAKATQAGVNVSALTWKAFIANNLLPVTLGNIAGGVLVGALMWAAYKNKLKSPD
ncbi:MAG: formate/nitrite transporter family protein [Bacillota bacterium]|nr:formate/nitrite transporter family protein [Bacillota bacterium]